MVVIQGGFQVRRRLRGKQSLPKEAQLQIMIGLLSFAFSIWLLKFVLDSGQGVEAKQPDCPAPKKVSANSHSMLLFGLPQVVAKRPAAVLGEVMHLRVVVGL